MEQLYYYIPALRSVNEFMDLGGDVLVLIVVLLLVMWSLIFERLLYINGPYAKVIADTVEQWEARSERNSWHAHAVREKMISIVTEKLDRNMSLIKTCIALSPLMGLLGTVTGMIEVFEVMALSGSGNARSMAAGVSKATVPTMAGMVAALSGVAMQTMLSNRIALEKEQLSDHLTTDH